MGHYVGAEREAEASGHSKPVRTGASSVTGGGPLSPGGKRAGLQDQHSQRCVHTKAFSLYCTQYTRKLLLILSLLLFIIAHIPPGSEFVELKLLTSIFK